MTADAMSCQKTIVQKIRDGKADYVIGLKGNQPFLLENTGSTSSAPRGNYENVLLNYLMQNSYWGTMSLYAPGSNQSVSTQNSLECLEKVMKFIAQ